MSAQVFSASIALSVFVVLSQSAAVLEHRNVALFPKAIPLNYEENVVVGPADSALGKAQVNAATIEDQAEANLRHTQEQARENQERARAQVQRITVASPVLAVPTLPPTVQTVPVAKTQIDYKNVTNPAAEIAQRLRAQAQENAKRVQEQAAENVRRAQEVAQANAERLRLQPQANLLPTATIQAIKSIKTIEVAETSEPIESTKITEPVESTTQILNVTRLPAANQDFVKKTGDH